MNAPTAVVVSAGQLRRRRWCVLAGLVAGTALLGVSLSLRPGDSMFYFATLALATIWVVAAAVSGPIPISSGSPLTRRGTQVAIGAAAGIAAAGVFLVGALAVREIPPLRDYVTGILAHAHQGSLLLILLVTVANAVGEEFFFRGALYSALPHTWHPAITSTLIYAAATAATGNPTLVFAALTLGIVLAIERRATGTILAPIITHVIWSAVMLFALSPLFPSH